MHERVDCATLTVAGVSPAGSHFLGLKEVDVIIISEHMYSKLWQMYINRNHQSVSSTLIYMCDTCSRFMFNESESHRQEDLFGDSIHITVITIRNIYHMCLELAGHHRL